MSQSDRAKALIKDMDAYFRAAKENEGEDGMKTQQPCEGGSPDSAKAHLGAGKEHEGHNEGSGKEEPVSHIAPSGQIRPALRLHDYKREPKKRVIAEALFERQKGRCNLESDHAACGGSYFEIDHADGDPDNWKLENLQLLCESHHRAKTNSQRAESRHPMGVRAQIAPIHYATSDASLEDIKHDNWAGRFAPWIRNLLEGPFKEVGNVVSYPALVGLTMDAVAYTDQWGNQHIPTESTAQRYIREECIRPKGCLRFCTRNRMKAVEFVGDGGKERQVEVSTLTERENA